MIETKEAPLDHQLAPQQQHPELTDGHKNINRPDAGHLTSDGALIANPIYGEMPITEAATDAPKLPDTRSQSKYPKQDTGTLEKIRAHQARIREQKALASAAAEVDAQAIAELQEIVNNPPPTAGEQLKETWQRLSALVRSIKIIDVQPVQDLPPSPVAQKLDEAKEIFDKLKSTSSPKSPEEEREIDRIAREKVNPQLAAENVASDVAHAIEGTITDTHLDDESVRKLVREYMASHTDITGDRNRIEQRTYERIVNKLAARRINEKNNPSIIKKISVEPVQPIIIPQTSRPAQTPIQIETTHAPSNQVESVPGPQIDITAAATNIIQRLQTDTTRSFETEETRRHRELQATNPEAVAGQTLPLHHENVEEMINRNLDAYLMNQRAGTANDETRAAIIARVRKGAQDRIALIERTNTVAQRILNGVNGRPDAATVNTAVDTYLAEHLGDQNLNRNELVQRTQTLLAQRPAPAPEAPRPPAPPHSEPIKTPVIETTISPPDNPPAPPAQAEALPRNAQEELAAMTKSLTEQVLQRRRGVIRQEITPQDATMFVDGFVRDFHELVTLDGNTIVTREGVRIPRSLLEKNIVQLNNNPVGEQNRGGFFAKLKKTLFG